MLVELLSDPKIVGSFLIGLALSAMGGFVLWNLRRGYCTRIPFSESSRGDWMAIPTEQAGIYDWFCTLVFGPFVLIFGAISLGFFVTELASRF